MVFYILTAIVFIAELVIAFALLFHLFKLNRIFAETSVMIKELQPHIKEIMELCTKISVQMLELAPIIVNGIKDKCREIIVGQVKNIVAGLTFWAVKRKVQRHLSN